MIEQLKSPKQVALAIGVSEASLKRWCDRGMLEFTRTAGGHRRIPVSSVIKFLRETGHELARPELFSLPAHTRRREGALDEAVEPVCQALEEGDTERFRQLIFGLYLAGREAVEICDRVIAPAFHHLGDRWSHGDVEVYQERRGCELCMRVLYELIALVSEPPEDAPQAIGATIEGDPYTLPTTMIELSLKESGWRAKSYGVNLPVGTMCAAIREARPRLFWLSVCYLENSERFVNDYPRLHGTASDCGTAIAVGGYALTEEVRKQIEYSTYCDTLAHLRSFAKTLVPRGSNTAHE